MFGSMNNVNPGALRNARARVHAFAATHEPGRYPLTRVWPTSSVQTASRYARNVLPMRIALAADRSVCVRYEGHRAGVPAAIIIEEEV